MDNNQTKLFDSGLYQSSNILVSYDPTWDLPTSDVEQPNSVREHVCEDTNEVAPERNHWVEEYWVERPTGKHYYYRYCYMKGRKIRHIHIPGGNSNAPLAIYRKIDVIDLISIGETPDKIVEIIKKQFK